MLLLCGLKAKTRMMLVFYWFATETSLLVCTHIHMWVTYSRVCCFCICLCQHASSRALCWSSQVPPQNFPISRWHLFVHMHITTCIHICILIHTRVYKVLSIIFGYLSLFIYLAPVWRFAAWSFLPSRPTFAEDWLDIQGNLWHKCMLITVYIVTKMCISFLIIVDIAVVAL